MRVRGTLQHKKNMLGPRRMEALVAVPASCPGDDMCSSCSDC